MPRRRYDDDDFDDDSDDRPLRKPARRSGLTAAAVAAGVVASVLMAAAAGVYFLVFAPFMAAPPPRTAPPVAVAPGPPPVAPKPVKANEFVFIASVKKMPFGRVQVEYSMDDKAEAAGGAFFMMVKHREGTESLAFGMDVGGFHTVEVYRTPVGTFPGEVTVWVEREKNGVRERVSPKSSAI